LLKAIGQDCGQIWTQLLDFEDNPSIKK
jgi:hypothetical protein